MRAGRRGDNATAQDDSHGGPCCPHVVSGPAAEGSTDVLINGRSSLRIGDGGKHSSCCGAETWIAAEGSATVLINGRGAHRVGDKTVHCGTSGELTTGSANVLIGEGCALHSSQESRRHLEFRVFLEVFFENGEPLRNEDYELQDRNGQVLRKGTTSSEGVLEECELDPDLYVLVFKNGWIFWS